MGFFQKLIKFFTMRAVEGIFVLALILIMPSLPPYGEYSSYKITPPRPLEGALAPNHLLEDAEKLYLNKYEGPESFADHNGELYFGVLSGQVLKLAANDKLEVVVSFASDKCEGKHTEPECGRPLGLKFDKTGNLYVVDAYSGIWRVNVKTGAKTLIISIKDDIDGKPIRIPNSIALASNGDIYWTDSSSEYQIRDLLYPLFADGTGRLFRYSASKKTNEVLIDNLYFANGVELSENEDFVIVNDLMKSRILRYYLKGAKMNTHDVFVDGLPGLPDNIQSNRNGGFLVGLVMARDAETPQFPQSLAPFPLIRKLIARIVGLLDFALKTINDFYPNYYTKVGVHYVGNYKPLPFLTPKRSTIVELDSTGNIIKSYHSMDGSISGICEGYIFGDYMYLGSPFNTYIARVKLNKLGLSRPQQVNKKETTQKPTTTTPKPTTTTPKPTTTTSKPTTTPKPTTTTPKPTTTTPKPTTTTPKPTTTAPKVITTTTTPQPPKAEQKKTQSEQNIKVDQMKSETKKTDTRNTKTEL